MIRLPLGTRVLSSCLASILGLALPALADHDETVVPETPTFKIVIQTNWLDTYLAGKPHHVLESPSSSSIVRIRQQTWNALPDEARNPLLYYVRSIPDTSPLPVSDIDTYHGPFPQARPGFIDPGEQAGLFAVQFSYRAPSNLPRILHGSGPLVLLWASESTRQDYRSRVWAPDLFAVPNASAPPRSVQWADDLRPEYKIEEGLESLDPTGTVNVWLTALRTPLWPETSALVDEAFEEIAAFDSDIDFKYVNGSVRKVYLEELALRPDVVAVTTEEYLRYRSEVRRSDRARHIAAGPIGTPPDDADLLLDTGSTGLWRIADEALDRMPVDTRKQWRLVTDQVPLPNGVPLDLTLPLGTPRPSPADATRRLVVVTSLWLVGIQRAVEEMGVPVLSTYGGTWTLFLDGEQQRRLEGLLIPPMGWTPTDPKEPERFLRFVEPLRPEWKTTAPLTGIEPPAATSVSIYRHPRIGDSLDLLTTLSRTAPIYEDTSVSWVKAHVTLDVAERLAVARLPDVYRLEVTDAVPERPTQPVLTVDATPGTLAEESDRVGLILRTEYRESFRIRRDVLETLDPWTRREVRILSDDVKLPFRRYLDPWNATTEPDAATDVTGGLGFQLVAPLVGNYGADQPGLGALLEAQGLELVSSPRRDGFLVWGKRADRESLARLTLPLEVVSQENPESPALALRWQGPFLPRFKIDPALLEPAEPGESLPTYQYVRIETRRHPESYQTLERIESLSPAFVQSRGRTFWAWLDLAAIDEVAHFGDVRRIERAWFAPGPAAEVLYRTVTLRAPPGHFDPGSPGVQELWVGTDIDSSGGDDVAIVRIEERLYDQLSLPERQTLTLIPHRIRAAGVSFAIGFDIDLIDERVQVPSDLAMRDPEARSLWLVKWIDEPRAAWLDWLEGTGARIVLQMRSNTTLAWMTPEQRAALSNHLAPPPFLEPAQEPGDAGEKRVVHWLGPYHPFFRMEAGLMNLLVGGSWGDFTFIRVSVVPDTEHSAETVALMEELGTVRNWGINTDNGLGRYHVYFHPEDKELVRELAHRPDIVVLHQNTSGGPSGGPPPSGGGQPPTFDPNDPRGAPTEIPVNGPFALALLATLLVLAAYRQLGR